MCGKMTGYKKNLIIAGICEEKCSKSVQINSVMMKKILKENDQNLKWKIVKFDMGLPVRKKFF